MDSPATQDRRTRVGRAAEAAARRYLSGLGWRILASNVRWREGELDLVGVDGRTLAFVEVKALVAHGGSTPFSPLESIDARKQRRIRSLARRWLVDELPRIKEDGTLSVTAIRFDAVAVSLHADGRVAEIDHVKGAF